MTDWQPGDHSECGMAQSRQRAGRWVLKLEAHSGQLLEGWALLRGVWFGLVDNRKFML